MVVYISNVDSGHTTSVDDSLPNMCCAYQADGVPYDVMCYNIECVYGTVIEESDLYSHFTPEQVQAARMAEFTGWEDMSVHEHISESVGRQMMNSGLGIFVSYRWVYSYTVDNRGSKLLKARLV